ncbi:hypothetical protein WA556_000211 [Blastocystis sp. ATCC 50177/Nand II]
MANNFLETESEAPPIESYASAFQRRRNAAASVKVHVVDSNTFLEIDEMLINLEDFRKYLRHTVSNAKISYLITIAVAIIQLGCSIITYSAFVIILAALSVVSSVVLYISLFITSSLYNYIAGTGLVLGIVSSSVLVYHLLFFSGSSFSQAIIVLASSLVYFFMLFSLTFYAQRIQTVLQIVPRDCYFRCSL